MPNNNVPSDRLISDHNITSVVVEENSQAIEYGIGGDGHWKKITINSNMWTESTSGSNPTYSAVIDITEDFPPETATCVIGPASDSTNAEYNDSIRKNWSRVYYAVTSSLPNNAGTSIKFYSKESITENLDLIVKW